MTRRLLPFVLATFALVASVPSGAAVLGPGTLELRGLAGFDRTSFDEVDVTTLQLDLGLARAVSEDIMLGFTLLGVHESLETDDDARSASSFGGTVDFFANFSGGERFTPFLQISAGAIRLESDGLDDGETILIMPKAGLGLRFLVSEHSSVNLLAAVGRESNDDENATTLQLRFGLSLFPGGIR